MSYVDAHVHLADPGYAGRLEEVLENATKNNVSQLLSNAVDYDSSKQTIAITKQFPEQVLPAVGVHPFTVTQQTNLRLDDFPRLIDDNAEFVKAIGEIGLDGKYTQNPQVMAKQNEVFRHFLALAEEKQLAAVVHSRQAVNETIDSLAEYHIPHVLLHWYDGPAETLPLIRERGYCISIGPAVLYSRRIAELARASDPTIILSETDGPVTYRGLFNDQLTEPSHVLEVVRRLAEIRSTALDNMRDTIFSNFRRFIQ